MHLQTDLDTPVRSTATIDDSAFMNNADVGLVVNAADLALSSTLIAETKESPNEFPKGDGLSLSTLAGSNTTTVTGCLLRDNARAGISVFSAPVTLTDSQLKCNAFDLNAEELNAGPAEITDGGGNECGCGEEIATCKAVSAGLEPPASL
jgi:hypothetical protein